MNFGCEKLISEVEKRPPLYNLKLKEYYDKYLRMSLWEEICQIVYLNYDQMSEIGKSEKRLELQKKWKNIKDTFRKELRYDKEKADKRMKRKYVYYDQLLFLVPSLTHDSSNEVYIKEEPDTITQCSEEADTQNNTSHALITKKQPKNRPTEKFEHQLLKILKDKRNSDIDEEKSFALSLVLPLKKLNDDQKDWAKVEILKVLSTARNLQFPHQPNHRYSQQLSPHNHNIVTEPNFPATLFASRTPSTTAQCSLNPSDSSNHSNCSLSDA